MPKISLQNLEGGIHPCVAMITVGVAVPIVELIATAFAKGSGQVHANWTLPITVTVASAVVVATRVLVGNR